MQRTLRATLVALLALSATHVAAAQALGPQRQFLAIEPFYEHTSLDLGSSQSRADLNGFGARLWINLDPFHFITNSSIALYGSHTPSQGGRPVKLTTYGAEYDQYFVRRPLGGLIDPFLTIGGGATRITSDRSAVFGPIGSTRTLGSVLPGGGIRIAIPNRFELRFDAKDLILFGSPTGTGGTSQRTNNLVLQGGLGFTF
ncbi:MAG: hypothetical protein M3Z05_09960 [Gemmatimonadota bacterium]|nr:hypothetical protein [Gemmatimonadota bacterium]